MVSINTTFYVDFLSDDSALPFQGSSFIPHQSNLANKVYYLLWEATFS